MTGSQITWQVSLLEEGPTGPTISLRTTNVMGLSGTTHRANYVGFCAWESGPETEWRRIHKWATSLEISSGAGRRTATIK